MTTATRFEKLDVWQNAKELTDLIYRLSATGSFARDFGHRDQMWRAAVSIMSNIAEGFVSQTQVMFVQYLARAKGSAGELRAQLYVALEQEYMTSDKFQFIFSLAEKCSRQLDSFIRYLESRPNARRLREDGVHYDIQP